jgi:uncharacterized protein (DUF302 family)
MAEDLYDAPAAEVGDHLDGTGPVVRASSLDVAQVVDRIKDGLRSRDNTLFALIDHAANAREVGEELADEVLLVFGNARVGTGLMQDDPRVGVELPLRMLVWADPAGTRIAFHDPRSLSGEFAVEKHRAVLAKMHELLEALAAEAAAP